MTSLFQILLLLIGVVRTVIIIHFIMSWLISFNVVNLRQPIVAQLWFGLQRLLEPIYGPIRRFVPNIGGMDLSPLVALLGVYAIEIIMRNNCGLFDACHLL
ncbi:YggT family protein [uncultured Litoreibacter sp.]|uniref:YggT family protein n=1 Tax=uncultured Litoreibacter sp. TaxID=1392394 RepID=UPI00261B4102|nr:YggT family protein [uncultured Litoreibacter sp.]